MNMADSRPRPFPKPRVRHKSLPFSEISSTNIDTNVSSSAPGNNKPPIIKPKPRAYKTLDFNNKCLVSITADIDIEDGSAEKNNNVANLKHIAAGKGKISLENVKSNKAEDVSAPGVKCGKPLPPLPVQSPAPVLEESSSISEDNSTTVNFSNFDMSNLPPKPPRLHSSASDSQLCSDEKVRDSMDRNSVFVGLNDAMTNRKGNPPLPRKPTCLRRSTGEEPEMENTNLKIKDSLLSTSSLNGERTSREPRQGMKMHTYSSDSQVGKLPKPSAFLKPSNKDNISNIGCTPPLPRKPAKRLSPAANQVSDLWKNDGSQPKMKDGSGWSTNRSRSPPDEQRIPTSSFPIKTDINCDEDDGDIECEEELINSPDEKDSGLNDSDVVSWGSKHMPNTKKYDKQINSGKSRPSSNQRKPLPAIPTSPNSKKVSSQGAPRRPPPSLPKQPSLERKRKTGPPPLPNAPRPASVARENSVQSERIRRSQSEGDIFGAATNEDAVYTEAYEHFRDSVYTAGSLKEIHDVSDDDDDYEFPDKDVVKEFMEAKQKSQANLQKKEIGLVGQVTEHEKVARKASTTYSSSSDDSEHEYVEPASPTPEKRTTKMSGSSPTNTVSSSGSSNYVEAIHVSELAGESGKSASSPGKYEFKPFSDMDNDWSKPKVIDWEYEGESDDSDTSYVEPDEVDEFDDFYDDDDEAFTDEPLYQIYQAVVLEKERTLSLKRNKKNSVRSPPTTPGAFSLRSGTLRGGKMLWSQLPEVRNTGLLENVSAEQRKLQEAIFEVISSEASYLKSLNLLVDHFLKSQFFSTDSVDSILDKHQIAELFSNVREIVDVSERFLDELRTRQRQSVLIESVSDIISNHATNHFQAYVSYCSSQYKQDRALMNLRKTNWRFADALEKLERDPRVFGLTLQSFLVLPMQRVTRYPLLVDAIVRRCEPGHKEYYKTDTALKAVNQVVYKCNEGARNEERREEMIQIEKTIAFLKMNPIKLVIDDRWLLRRGPIQLLEMEGKSTLSNTLRGRFKKYRVKPIYLFLFSDLLVVTKRKTETMYSVIDYAKRNMIRIQESTSNAKNSFLLVFLENFQKKTKELNLRADNETDLTRWREAFQPPSASADDEKIYDSWDCPQVQALHNYQAQQSDELSLVPGDVVNVLRKLPDGWFEGERIRDGVCGWFPANHTEEIRNEHVRARNLHQRYRLLAASTAFLDKRKR